MYCKITNNVTISREKIILPKKIFKYDFEQIAKIYCLQGNRLALKCIRKTDVVEIFHEICNFLTKYG